MANIKKACKGTLYPKSSSVSKRLKAGGSFPDLNKDGKITKKDILIGKGVLPKTAKKGMKVKKAQDGSIETAKKFSEERNMMRQKEGEKQLSRPMIKPKTSKFVGPMQPGKSRPMMKKGGKTKKCAYGCK
jgi:hypothetical protein